MIQIAKHFTSSFQEGQLTSFREIPTIILIDNLIEPIMHNYLLKPTVIILKLSSDTT